MSLKNNIFLDQIESTGFLKMKSKASNQQIKTQAYQALVRPKLEYSCSIWNPYTSESIRKIEMVQRRAARYICNIYHNTSSVSDMLNKINLPSLAERRLRTRLVMMYKVSFHLVAVPSDILIASDTGLGNITPNI